MTSELVELTAVEQRRLVGRREVSAMELLDAHLARIEATNAAVNAVVALDPDVGRRRARAVDDAIARGDEPGPLAGLVTAHKDLTETADFPTTYGSALFAGFRPAADSLLVARMLAAGAVAVGKTNTPELGAGSHTFNSVYGTTVNPWDLARSAGGSSGGAAAALACRMVATADGSDMGGSLRNPAAWNGVVGLRPTPRAVPKVGPGNAWLPLGVEGPMGRTVADVALLLAVLAASDGRDPMHRPIDVPAVLAPVPRPVRAAWSDDLGGLPVEPSQRAVLAGTRETLDALGWEVVDAAPDFAGAAECFTTLRAWSFATSPVAQLDDRVAELKSTIQDEIRRGRLLTPEMIASAYDRLGELWRRAHDFFARFDVLVAPVTQVAPFPAGQEYPHQIDGSAMSSYIEWMASCWQITVTGCPALSLPAGFDHDGLPVGVQLVGRQGNDVGLLQIAAALEAAIDISGRRPPVVAVASGRA